MQGGGLMPRDRRRAKLSHRDLIAELDHDLDQVAAAGGIQLALFHLQEVVDSLAEARRRWAAAKVRGRKAVRALGGLKTQNDRYGRQLTRAVLSLQVRLEGLLAP